MADIQFDSQYKEFDKARNALGHQTAGLVGFLIKISGGHLKVATATNILVVVTIVSFTLSITIFWDTFLEIRSEQIWQTQPVSKKEIIPALKGAVPAITDSMFDRLPEKFYREDIPKDIADMLPQDLITSIPSRPQ